MKEYKELLSEFKDLYEVYSDGKKCVDALKCGAVLGDYAEKIRLGLQALNVDDENSMRLLKLFVLGSLAADGRYSDDELDFCHVLVADLFEGSTPEEIKEEFSCLDVKHLQHVADDLADLLGEASEELKEEIVLVCMIVCGIDGKITSKEKKWICTLIEE